MKDSCTSTSSVKRARGCVCVCVWCGARQECCCVAGVVADFFQFESETSSPLRKQKANDPPPRNAQERDTGPREVACLYNKFAFSSVSHPFSCLLIQKNEFLRSPQPSTQRRVPVAKELSNLYKQQKHSLSSILFSFCLLFYKTIQRLHPNPLFLLPTQQPRRQGLTARLLLQQRLLIH